MALVSVMPKHKQQVSTAAGAPSQPDAVSLHGLPPVKVRLVPIKTVKANADNPRVVRDHKFDALVRSIREFPQMLMVRPIIVNEQNVVLGGNQRLRACQAAGMKRVPIGVAVGWTEEQQREFIVKDNESVGEWDWTRLVAQYGQAKLDDWGVSVPPDITTLSDAEMERFFEEGARAAAAAAHKLVLSYTKEDHARVVEALKSHGATPEQAVWNLLCLGGAPSMSAVTEVEDDDIEDDEEQETAPESAENETVEQSA